ncbi:UDP-N-acetylglucosamine 1-carboxyvinyltransferase [Ferrimicrobium acidiphilum]|jgi:UDP-N-acetylglucosamine 1-carboxyvinyltransferase|uniref:UDP-N-acetylglucosamine 1-carboxyvinyltransferase n=1 Tax=Ferrimicrobium acidiphilum DSM 19497 TaxID=1121877 RepID=A0A0D8FW83_9ACTN|nr:UDP-N-acetylglucosamine 1-carboxyvinyltransferase [Ferrimicrobium acidiphilum]KJE77545.1 UDP-N-acetylglucosamine 1-carboxyvinyltransferase [Ferrimicrobium acidiphilum DSM 19497]
MRAYRIQHCTGLEGNVEIQGAKNSVLKLMAASILASGVHVLDNVPRITDVEIMRKILVSLGVDSRWLGSHRLEISVPEPEELASRPDYGLVKSIRASVVLLGPILARTGEVALATPGGDDFGERPVDIHELALTSLGAVVEAVDGQLIAKADRLAGSDIVLEFPSHTATDNVLMAAVTAEGRTTIENAAREPEVIDLAQALIEMGAQIDGVGTSRIIVEGVDRLRPMNHRVIGDRVVAATYMTAVGAVGGQVRIEGVAPSNMLILIRKLTSVGLNIEVGEEWIDVIADGSLRAVDIQTLPYPGVATDYKPMLVAMLSIADGVSVVSENLFAGRFRYLDELRRYGANVRSEGHHIIIRGVPRLLGAEATAHDIRAGAALVVASLAAFEESQVNAVDHIERGYDALAETLVRLGATIETVEV